MDPLQCSDPECSQQLWEHRSQPAACSHTEGERKPLRDLHHLLMDIQSLLFTLGCLIPALCKEDSSSKLVKGRAGLYLPWHPIAFQSPPISSLSNSLIACQRGEEDKELHPILPKSFATVAKPLTMPNTSNLSQHCKIQKQ